MQKNRSAVKPFTRTIYIPRNAELFSPDKHLSDRKLYTMNRITTFLPIPTGSSAMEGASDLTSRTRFIRLAAGQLNSALARTVHAISTSPGTSVEGLKSNNGNSPVNQCLAGVCPALLLGMALLIGSAQASKAGTLTFTFNDDGSTTTITPTGTLDFGTLSQDSPDNYHGNHHIIRIAIPESGGHAAAYIFNSSSKNVVTYNFSGGRGNISGKDSFDGVTQASGLPSYNSNFRFYISTKGIIIVDTDHITGSVFDVTKETVTFTDTISNTLKDNNFHVEYKFEDQKVIFQTKPLVKPTGLKATQGDGQVELSWTDPVNSSIHEYQYQQKEEGGEYGEWEDMDPSDAYTTSYTIKGLAEGVRYSFRIRALKDDGSKRSIR